MEFKKYRKKPIVIDAFQLTEETLMSMYVSNACDPDIIIGTQKCHICRYITEKMKGLSIPTLEGTMFANIDDWIIKGVNGEIYPCKPDIFDKCYEKVC